ncbi:MAG: hypothetical protein EA376_02480 [Phycisphaeraceae bacterium]|nr:MAG: hypothetical protein EA376_02480 [Phycisphaeraceae bacterium]
MLCGAGLFLLCAMVSYLVSLAVMAEPVPAPDVTEKMNELLAAALPDGSDATPLLMDFMERRNELPYFWDTESGERESTNSLLHQLRVRDWSDPELSLAHEAWSQISPLLSLLHEAAAHDVVRAPYVRNGVDGFPGNETAFGRFRSPTREILRIAIRDAAEREAWDEVERNLETTLRLAHHLGQRLTLDDLTAASMLAYGALLEIILQSQERRIPHEVCERLIDVINRVDPLPAPIERVCEVERLRTNAYLSQLFSRSGIMIDWMEGNFTSESSLIERLANVRALAAHRRSLAENAVDEQFHTFSTWWEALPGERIALQDNLVYPDRIGDGNWEHIVWFNESNFRLAFHTRNTLPAGVRTALRIAQFRDMHGHWPETLEEALSGEELLETLTGEKWQYTRLQENRYGQPYRLVTPPQPGYVWYPIPLFRAQGANVIDLSRPRGASN